MRSTTSPPRRRLNRAAKNLGSLLGALGLVSVGLAACESGEPRGGAVDQGSATPGVGTSSDTTSASDPPACVDVDFDHDVACEDMAAAKDQAGADCQSRGLKLTAFGRADDCPAGELRRLKYTCCPPTGAPPPPPPPDPVTREPGSCVFRSQGGPTICESLADWKSIAAQDCAASGYEVGSISLNVSCGDQAYRITTYACCTKDGTAIPTTPDPPQPPDPFVGAPVPGPARYAQYKCCTSPSSCTVEQLGGESVCKDLASWQADAATACPPMGGTVHGLGLYESCSP